ncbi:MAG: hypothetical protein JW748_12105 [Anaerolineales bacterium]|nr:hypothetical protein [Anaerolineales bacterium]
MVILELKDLAMVLERKVTAIQREFTLLADQLAVLRRKWVEEEETERPRIIQEQETLKEKQLVMAEQVNVWRDRLRAIENPTGEKTMLNTLEELLGCGDAEVVEAVNRAKKIMAMSPEEKAALFNRAAAATSNTPVGRLVQRAKSAYDLRSGGSRVRQEAAVEFSNRTGMAQDDAILTELEVAMQDEDPVVSDVAIRTLVQILRFRAVRAAELDSGQAAVQRLVKIKDPVVIPVLIEILKNPRQGYLVVDGNLQEGSNGPARLLALIALVEFRTKEAQDVLRMRRYDKDQNIANAAERALQAFPGEWSGKTD